MYELEFYLVAYTKLNKQFRADTDIWPKSKIKLW